MSDYKAPNKHERKAKACFKRLHSILGSFVDLLIIVAGRKDQSIDVCAANFCSKNPSGIHEILSHA